MTEKEALEFFEGFIKTAPVNPYTQSAKLAIKALKEKQIPKRAISIYKGNYKCPTCENYIDITDDDLYVYEIEPPKYCDECGQALDWSDEECGS